MTAAKKLRERFLLDRFLQLANLAPSEICEDEAPDFVLQFSSGLVGLEVTEVFVEPTTNTLPLRARESLTERIVFNAKALYDARSLRPAFVNVCFFDPQIDQRLRRDALSVALAGQIQRLIAGAEGPVHWRNDYSDQSLRAIALLSVFPVTKASEGRWNVARAGWVAPLSATDLAAVVERKNSRYDRYTRHVPKAWLLLAIDGGRPSQFFEIDDQLDLSMLGSRFDKIFLLRTSPPLLICHSQ